uniref:Metalloendopeptidase n=1 Tax=Scylla olivacea TaxID=85551 RepID=A0A0P4WGL6_SCYOL
MVSECTEEVGGQWSNIHLKDYKTSFQKQVHSFPNPNRCSSAVGKVGGGQSLSLGTGCVHVGVVIHELMHAVGFWHEQSRYDRDSFVTIRWENIMYGLGFNFDKVRCV